MAVRSTQGRNRAARSMQEVSPSWKWIVVHVVSLSGLGFQIKYIATKVKKNNFLFKTFILQKNASLPFYTYLGLPCTLLSCE